MPSASIEIKRVCTAVGTAGIPSSSVYGRDLPGQLDVVLARGSAEVGCQGDQPHRYAVVPHVDVRPASAEAAQLTDRVDEPRTAGERSGAEMRALAYVQHSPVLHAVGLVKLTPSDRNQARRPLGHAGLPPLAPTRLAG